MLISGSLRALTHVALLDFFFQKKREKMSSQEELYGSLDLDRHVQNFKNCLRVLLSDERLMHGGKSTETEVIRVANLLS